MKNSRFIVLAKIRDAPMDCPNLAPVTVAQSQGGHCVLSMSPAPSQGGTMVLSFGFSARCVCLHTSAYDV